MYKGRGGNGKWGKRFFRIGPGHQRRHPARRAGRGRGDGTLRHTRLRHTRTDSAVRLEERGGGGILGRSDAQTPEP